jgi:TRAP-type C4-dicarboxylate transport system substrate-binding protein
MKKYQCFDKLPPEAQKIIRDYWKDVKQESRQRNKLGKSYR